MAGAAVLLAAADTYVVVLALPSIMSDLGIDIQELQRATPIVSGFLLGYVAVLPLLGRLSDRYGRGPVFLSCLGIFAAGSLVTASGQTLAAVVAGRTLQGLGGGGLVPVTLALVADGWPPSKRGAPLGAVGAAQELGALAGPLYGAAVISLASWRWIFWLNLPLAAVAALAFLLRGGAGGRTPGLRDPVGGLLLGLAAAAAVLAVTIPAPLASSDTLGQLYAPQVADAAWSTPMVGIAGALLAAACAWELAEPGGLRPLLPLRRLPNAWRAVDWPGATLLAGTLGCVVLAFAAADPAHEVVAGGVGIALLPTAALLGAGFVIRELRATDPLVRLSALRERAAWGALVVNLLVGAALMAALVDVPLFARATVDPGSQVGAALVLTRFLVAVPVGALAGGVLCQRLGNRAVAAAGMLLSGLGFAAMAGWDAAALGGGLMVAGRALPVRVSDVHLLLAGLGFGLVIAPVNAAMLGAVRASLHGLASALVVVARSMGMLVGLSLLTALGLRRFYAAEATIPPVQDLCPAGQLRCPAYDARVTAAVLSELHLIFAAAALCALGAAICAALLLGGRTAASAPTARGRTPVAG
ncbi:MAG: MFS transporter [Candidatus Dormibacteria bacterium]